MIYFLYIFVRRVFKNAFNGINDILVIFWIPPTSSSAQVSIVQSSPSTGTLKRISHSKNVYMDYVDNSHICKITWKTID